MNRVFLTDIEDLKPVYFPEKPGFWQTIRKSYLLYNQTIAMVISIIKIAFEYLK